jgi:hypothetical protein
MKKIYISFLTLIVFTVIFGTVTYAWITIATVNNIEGMYLTASTGDELQISTDGYHFSTTLGEEELLDIFEDQSLKDVTTLDGINFYRGGLNPIGEATANKDFLSFELWFRTTTKERYVYLVNDVSNQMSYDITMQGTYFISRGVEWTANVDFLYDYDDIVKTGETRTYYAKDSLRIGFQEVIDGPYDQRNESDLNTMIYDPSNNQNRGYGESIGAYNYFLTTQITQISLPEEKPQTIYELTQIAEDNPYQALDNQSLITELQPTGFFDEDGNEIYQSKVIVNIWIEGWDADAFNAVLKDYIKIQLQFKNLKKAMV